MSELENAPGEVSNPLDNVEEILSANNWMFNRMNADELMVHVSGTSCDYRLFFIWEQNMSTLQFCCQFDMHIGPENFEAASRALMAINETLWMGHFDIPKQTGTPTFRQTCLLRGLTRDSGFDHIEDLVDIAMAQCERYYPVFFLLTGTENPDEQNLSLALMETRGQS